MTMPQANNTTPPDPQAKSQPQAVVQPYMKRDTKILALTALVLFLLFISTAWWAPAFSS
ncbi:hypothetical protein [Formicincola oecophyllae]|uniref:hypothetical protein n=1 Tax=Formicincola oecophyllae TaxID=2558361 RepID=UPI00143DD4AF|nr:hypothetical protein [Formicincola oecophyllae]